MAKLTDYLSSVYYKLTPTGFRLPDATGQIKIFCDTNPSYTDFDHSDYVYIYPCLQMKNFNFNQDVKSTEIIWSALPSIKEANSEILLCTGYFNIRKGFEQFILKSKHKWKILTSSPEANSFYNLKGLGSCIPELYQYNLHKIAEKSKNRDNNIAAYEYQESMQTFHAKGNIYIFRTV